MFENELFHYGTKRHSGRYPWGSGDSPYQHSGDFLGEVEKLKSEGWKETPLNIKEKFGLSTTEYRTACSLAKSERRAETVARIEQLKERGYSNSAIGRELGINESSVRSYLDENAKARTFAAKETADYLRKQVEEKGIIDVGKGVDKELNVSSERMKQALYVLELEGYKVIGGRVSQATNPGKKTTIEALALPDTEDSVIYQHPELVKSVLEYVSPDGGDTFEPKFQYPASMDSSRLAIRYAEDGGINKDGVIEIRRGVPDLSLGKSNYAQVRIMVDDQAYLKGMAIYSDDLPDGVDVLFNTNKKNGTPLIPPNKNVEGVLKLKKSDPDDPFGSLLKEEGGQSTYDDPITGEKRLSLINKTREEGDWSEWADKIPAQFLSKQSTKLAEKQLKLTLEDRDAEYDEIMSLTNPTLRKNLLMDYAESCDSNAVDLKAISFPRQKYKVILPLNDIADDEVYAPSFNNGEKVALIRYPHAGTFEIPILTVNNKNAEGQKVLGMHPDDAVGINSVAANKLSGADFDGDTVTIIPLSSAKIKGTPALDGLKDFDPKVRYATTVEQREKGEVRLMQKQEIQRQMGEVSNLITDMTLKGAPVDEIEKAVKHSMVVIDAYKHKLDFKRSEVENDIARLKAEYQGEYDDEGYYHEGASTLISRSKGQLQVPERKELFPDKETGEKRYAETGRTYKKLTSAYQKLYDQATTKEEKTAIWDEARKNGGLTESPAMTDTTKMAEAKDARTLVSKTNPSTMEFLYADFANGLKDRANKARREALNTKDTQYDPAARKLYDAEVKSLEEKVKTSELNAPRERQAQLRAAAEIKSKVDNSPEKIEKSDLKKMSQKALSKARLTVGAQRHAFDITDKEWEAIQAGAVTPTRLANVLKYADSDRVKQLAMPKATTTMTEAKLTKMRTMMNSGRYTTAQIADALGISTSTVSKVLNG